MYLVETVYGSRLFGTSLPTSDMDLKRVFVSDMEDLVFGRTSTRNYEDVRNGVKFETEEHHISSFCRMVKQGQTLVYSMMFTPWAMITHCTEPWEELIANRHRLISKNLKPYVGYARSQAQKYSLKGDRLETLEKFIQDVKIIVEAKAYGPDQRISSHQFEGLSQHYEASEGVRLWTETVANGTIRHIEVCGKSFGETTPIKLWLGPLEQLHHRYGKRSQQAKEDKGTDLKAMYHAIRLVGELNEILRTGNLSYPRPDASLLLDVQLGKLTNGEVAALIDRGVEESERLFVTSALPEKSDEEWLDAWMVRTQASYAIQDWTENYCREL